MVQISSTFTLPPVIRRFGRCGEWDHRIQSASSEVGDSSHGEVHRNKPKHHPSPGGAETGTERVKSFVNGIVSPFTSCWQPSEGPCVPGCGPDRFFLNQPAVVSPHSDRVVSYRDSRFEHEQTENSRQVHHYGPPNSYHRPRFSPIPPSTAFASRREPAVVESDGASNCEKRKRSTDIEKPLPNDILCGRGGSSNRHQGNVDFRELVAANKQIYVGLTKKQKMMIARKIVDTIHSTGGRFIAKDNSTGFFYDIGLPRSLEKTSQALREKHSNEMPLQPAEEGIETSVESHDSVIKNIGTTDEKKLDEDLPDVASSSSKSSTKGSKNKEAPSLIIPPHLLNKFGKKKNANKEDSENSHQNALSPRANYHPEQPYSNHRPHYPPSWTSPPHQNRKNYPPVAGHPPVQPAHFHHGNPPYPVSPVPNSNQYPPHPHYYYHGYPPHHAPYYRHGGGKVYNHEYYARSKDQTAPRVSPHGMPPHAQYHHIPGPHPPSYYHGHPAPRSSIPPSSNVVLQPTLPKSGSSSQPSQRSTQHDSNGQYRNENTTSSPSRSSTQDASPSSRIIYRATNNGYVRCNSDVSPTRQRELKRPRNGDAKTAKSSEASLSSAVENSLSLDERVVGREREKLQQSQEGKSAEEGSSRSNPLQLVSPSSMLQSKSCSRGSKVLQMNRESPAQKKIDYSALSGLAALSTAAFLKLDEEKT